MLHIQAQPEPFAFDPEFSALLIIDIQRDFLEPGGFGETLRNDVSLLAVAVPPLQALLAVSRAANLMVLYTRGGDRADARPAQIARGMPAACWVSCFP